MVFRELFNMMMGCLGLSKRPTRPDFPVVADDSSGADLHIMNSLRIRLSDGRFLAYKERGVPKNKSTFIIVVIHGFGSSKDMNFMASQEFLDELGICLLLFDRAGYGESDPNPKRSLKSEASDIEELADKLQLGSKFYVLGVSLGCYPIWSCLKRIPDRLAGAALVVPYINYKWPSLPSDLTNDDYRKGLSKWAVFVASHSPGLLHWWLTQKLFPSSTVLDRNTKFFSNKDLEVLKHSPGYQLLSRNKLRNRVVFDSLRRDFIVAFGKWEFDPMDIHDPCPQKESMVHIWQGREDKIVPYQLQRYVSKKLPWIRYHEVPDGGHLLVYDGVVCEVILRSLVFGEDPPLYRPQAED
ncbi:putative lysophospholipase BODYGUARD 1 [Primulina tabacum]|uniref:putative lysophospholipase BODYGUARD 1 n=1 Tax=Primulina tabacum TaxID=48773 RepID=UPI003F59EEE1